MTLLTHWIGGPVITFLKDNTAFKGTDTKTQDSSDEDLKPTVVWIDDRLEMIQSDIGFAKGLGIHVVNLPSTSAAKLWIQANEG